MRLIKLACAAAMLAEAALCLPSQSRTEGVDRFASASSSSAGYSHCSVQASFYVSPDGNDANPGTPSAPFLTAKKAIGAATASIAAGMTGDIVIILRGGSYRLAAPLAFGPASSGQNGCKLVLQSYPGEQAIIDGSQPISGWSLHDSASHIYRAYVGKDWNFRQLYVNGRYARRARLDLQAGDWRRTSTGFAAVRRSTTHWADLAGAEIVVLGKWMTIRCPVAAATADTMAIAEPCWKNAQWAVRWGATLPSWIENKYRFLTRPGDWFLDRNFGYVYYVPQRGENIVTAEVTAPVVENLVIGESAHDLVFRNLQFAGSNWSAPDDPNGYVGLQAGYHKVGADGRLIQMHSAIGFSASREIIFEGNTFKHLGSTALSFSQGSQDIYILGNRFVAVAGGAVQFGQIDDGSEVDVEKQNRFFLIRNNYIRDIGLEYSDNAAIAGFYVAGMVAEHNDIGSIPHYGISVGWGWGKEPSYTRNNQIAWNYIHDFSQLFSDSAAIYTLGPSPGTVIHHNYLSGGGRGYGCLYPDEGSAYQNWTANVCENAREWLHVWTGSIHDNHITGNFTDTANMENHGRGNDIVNNVVASGRNWPAAAVGIKAQSELSGSRDER